MSQAISQAVGTNVRVYLNSLKGVKRKSGKERHKVISFYGKVHEIRNDYLIIKGLFTCSVGFSPNKNRVIRQICCKKFHFSEIMRVVTIEDVKN